MNNLFESKVRYEKIDDKTGKEKIVTETYLFDAVSFTEAETRAYKEMEKLISGEFTVKTVAVAKYSDVFPDEISDKWYKSKISFMSVDEKSGKEKKISSNVLVMANTVKEAYDNIAENMGDMTVDFDVISIAESPILDFFPYNNEEVEK